MRGISLRKKRQALYGWVKWIPVVAAPFIILLADTWLNICTWQNDYAYRQLDRQLQAVQAQLAKVSADTADMQDLHSLTERATELAMVEPSPDQIKTIKGTLPPFVQPEDLPQDALLTMASLEQGAEQAKDLVRQVVETDISGMVAGHAAPSMEAVARLAEPLPQWIRQEVAPALETARQLGVPMKDALLETASGLRETVSTFAPAAASRLGAFVEPAATDLQEETLEPLATISSLPGMADPRPPAAPAIENDPNNLLESL